MSSNYYTFLKLKKKVTLHTVSGNNLIVFTVSVLYWFGPYNIYSNVLQVRIYAKKILNHLKTAIQNDVSLTSFDRTSYRHHIGDLILKRGH